MIKYYKSGIAFYRVLSDQSYLCISVINSDFGLSNSTIAFAPLEGDTEITAEEFNAVLNSVKEKINQL